MKKLLLSLLLGCATTFSAQAVQVKEKLNRAPVAVKAKSGVLVSWRSFTSDASDLAFTVSRNGTVIASNITTKTNYHDTTGKAGDEYTITASNGESFTAKAWKNMYTRFPLQYPGVQAAANGSKSDYLPDDASVGDLDGDGEYEIVLKWMPKNQQDNGYNGYTSPCIIDAYEMDGTLLWRINLGLNIRSGNHYTQFLVYDFDGDGKAEMICKTAPGSKDGKGNYVSAAGDATIQAVDNTKKYVNGNGHVTGGEEFLTVFNGQTGAAMNTIWYNPSRSAEVGKTGATSYGKWESEHGKSTNYNRGERYTAAVAYLDGLDKLPSAILERGYYGMCFVWAVDWNGTKLTQKWLHFGDTKSTWKTYNASNTKISDGSGKSSWGQGVHGISVGDVDGDGFDEVVTGGATIDHDGKLLCSTGKGHGDAIHLTDLCPDRPGLEIMMPHEESPYGYDVHDATTGELLVSATSTGDNGRGLALDFIPANRGSEFWSSADNNTYDCATGKVALSSKGDTNFRIYWTADPYDQTFDGRYDSGSGKSAPRIRSYSTASKKIQGVVEFSTHGAPQSCNTTKATPCLQADLLGDWREELVMYQAESTSKYYLAIYSTPEKTNHKVPCLMEDHVYRMGVAWQNSAYNQPPHLGYSLPDYLKINGSTYATQTSFNTPTPVKEEDIDVPTDPEAPMEEVVGVPAEDKAIVSGTSYTAGVNGEWTNSTKGSYTKIRTNLNTQIEIKVNAGYTITGIEIQGYSNNTSTTADRSIDLIGLYVDGSTTNILSKTATFPGGTTGQTPITVKESGFKANNNIILAFDNSKITDSATDPNGKNAQLYASFSVTYVKADEAGTQQVETIQIPVSFDTYDLLGRKVSSNAKGIVINNNKVYAK